MWRSISLRNRLTLIFGLLFVLWFAADALRLVVEASARARAETQSAMRLTKDFLATAVAGLQDAPDPARALQALVAGLQNVRHVRVGVGGESLGSAILLAADDRSEAPRWFRALVRAPSQVESFPVLLNGRRMASIVIVADPSDEIDEAWAGARDEMLVVAALAAAAMGAMSLLVGRAMKPLGVVGATLARLAAGDYPARAEVAGPPEIRNLNAKVNSLGEALDGLNRANGELMERVFDAHDQERRMIAHELHDEFGPHLFALRASAAILAKKLGGDPAAAAAASAVGAQVEALQVQNRRILADLRPAALDELGLSEALNALVAHWRRVEPGVALTLRVDPRAEALSERASQMVYRFVQEAMTNAFRHSGATRIDVSLRFEAPARDAGLRGPAPAGLVIQVADDGRGLQGEHAAGMGLTGMRDRVRMLGGQVLIGSPSGQEFVVEARIPAAGEIGRREKIPTCSGTERVNFPND
ncbi:MAG TPA: histidine kinase [Roseiarcus sp.]|nr:histidine kinase [Roseiarcus sp.]